MWEEAFLHAQRMYLISSSLQKGIEILRNDILMNPDHPTGRLYQKKLREALGY